MKNIFIIGLVLFSTRASFAQANPSKVEQYCQIIATPRLFSNKVTIDIDFGEEKSICEITGLKPTMGRSKSLIR